MARKKKKTQRKRTINDSHADREAVRYAQPIHSREAIISLLEKMAEPVMPASIAKQLGLVGKRDKYALTRRLSAMVRDGQLVQNRRGEILVAARAGLVSGTVLAHREGFGFLIPDDQGDDIFLSPRQMRELMHGDRAVVRVRGLDAKGRREGSVVDVLERKTRNLVGRYFRESGVGFIVPDNPRFTQEVMIPDGNVSNAQAGQIVIVEIIEYPGKHKQAVGRVTKVLGNDRAAGMEVEIAIHSHSIPHEWAQQVLQSAEAFGNVVPKTAIHGRVDLRNLPLVTIDGADARDFDDAVFCEPRGEGWRLIVAIADVSHYVTPGSALDNEASERATSVYFPDWVVPMLPEALSNGLCSLNPEVDRLCMVCEMHVDAKGKVTRTKFYQAIMRSHARLVYDQVAEVLQGTTKKLRKKFERVLNNLQSLHAVYRKFSVNRRVRGAIEFDRPETRIVFDVNRKIEEIVPVQRNIAHRIIEECMIAANVQAAKFIKRQQVPALYRVHAGPESDRLEKLREFLSSLGLRLGGGGKPQAKNFANLLDKLGHRDDRYLVETVLLRSLAQAVYSPTNIGHFGLALECYSHFTSPIRRYPDLLLHRAIKHVLGKSRKPFYFSPREIEASGHHCSMAERRADDATRDAVAWLKCDYMQDRIGESFDAMITGVTGFGLFVEILESSIEGLVHVTSLDSDYYQHDDVHHCLVGERSGKVYRLADKIQVKLLSVDMQTRKIDFELANVSSRRSRRKRQ